MKRFALFVLLVGICTGISQADVPASQRQALIDLYNSTNGSNWYDAENWRNGADTDFNDVGTECTWFGVTCNGTGDSVTGLNLNGNELSGSIPASIEDLADLQNLELSSNQLTGSIPPELGNISALGQLQLSFNQLSGSIPVELANLSNLWGLALKDNQLEGSIPPELGNLSNLYYIALESNQLSGNIPPELANISGLQGLYLSSNQLGGSIPSELANLVELGYLELGSNRLTGSIPSEFGSVPMLEILHLDSNQLSGSIPSELANLTALADGSGLDLRWNALHSEDATLIAFLDTKQEGGDWQGTQTVAPADLQATLPTSSSVVLEWTPISYTADVGRYMVFADPPFWDDVIFFDGFESHDTKWWGIGMPWVTTTDKTDTSILVQGLISGVTYDFIVRTITEPHADNQNQVVSEASVTVTETIPTR